MKTNPSPATEQVTHSLVSGPPVSSSFQSSHLSTKPPLTSLSTSSRWQLHQSPSASILSYPCLHWQKPHFVGFWIILVAQTSVYLEEPPISLTKFCFLLDNTLEAPAVPFGSQLCPSVGLTSPCLTGDLACTQLWFFQVRTNSRLNPGQPLAHTRVSTNTLDWPSEAWVRFPGPGPSFLL